MDDRIAKLELRVRALRRNQAASLIRYPENLRLIARAIKSCSISEGIRSSKPSPKALLTPLCPRAKFVAPIGPSPTWL